ncbi:LptM family lipoprotein [Halobacillus sp. B23F22_1]|uniref:LptM family lipoprotein n=1 Tax=Halobacillus sp. B23F22_1 TaxID=3459514 RepID=UPI00373F2B76
MVLKKKWFVMLAAIIMVFVLAACGDKGKAEQSSGEEANYDNPRNHTAEDFMPLSEGLGKYPVWIETDENPVRDSKINNIYVFNNSQLTIYPLDNGDIGTSGVVLEDILDMSDEELIKFARKTVNNLYDDYEKEIKDRKLFDIESFNESQEGFHIFLEDYFDREHEEITEPYYNDQKPMKENIYYGIEGERTDPSPSKYSLDIKIDDLGQTTEKMELIVPNATSKLVNNSDSISFSDYIEFLYYDLDTILLSMEDQKIFTERKESYVEKLNQYGNFIENNDLGLNHPQNFVPHPYTWEEKNQELSINTTSFNEKIFDTTFSGIKTGSGSLVTRVDDSFIGFRLDDPDTDKENVTIEGN